MYYRFISIGFPLYLLLFELIVKKVFSADISNVIGPTLAGAGLGFMVDSLKPKYRDDVQLNQDLDELAKQGLVIQIQSKKDLMLTRIAGIALILGILLWLVVCINSIGKLKFSFDFQYFGGFFCYIVGVSLSLLKEYVK